MQIFDVNKKFSITLTITTSEVFLLKLLMKWHHLFITLLITWCIRAWLRRLSCLCWEKKRASEICWSVEEKLLIKVLNSINFTISTTNCSLDQVFTMVNEDNDLPICNAPVFIWKLFTCLSLFLSFVSLCLYLSILHFFCSSVCMCVCVCMTSNSM